MQIAGSIFQITPPPIVILNFSTSLSFDFTLRNDTFFTGGGRLLSTQNSNKAIADSRFRSRSDAAPWWVNLPRCQIRAAPSCRVTE